jgi:hypothetical protein
VLQEHWLPDFNFNVEEWDAKGQIYETLAICRSLELASVAFKAAIAEKPARPGVRPIIPTFDINQ